MEPNTNEATAPKRLKTGGKKPIIIIGVIVAVLLAAYVGLCAYANSLDIFYPNTTINGVDVAGLTAEQAAERLRQEIPEETVEFYLPLADETGDGESAPEGDMLYGADPDAVCTYRELGITEELDYEVSAQSAFDAVQGRSSFFVKGWEYLACLVGADGQLGVVLEPEEDIFQVKMEQLSEQFSREAQDASYEVTEDAVEITKALNGLSVSAADLARTVQERWTGSGNGAAASVFVNNARILPAKTLTAQEIYDDCSGEVKNASYDKETESIVPEQAGADFDVDEAQKMLDAAEPGETRRSGAARRHGGGAGAGVVPGRAGGGPHSCGRHLRPPVQCEALGGGHQRLCDEHRRRVLLQRGGGTADRRPGLQGGPRLCPGGDGGRDRRRHLPDFLHAVPGLSAVQSGDHGAVRPPLRPRLYHRGHGRHGVLGRAGLQVHQQLPVPHQDRHHL